MKILVLLKVELKSPLSPRFTKQRICIGFRSLLSIWRTLYLWMSGFKSLLSVQSHLFLDVRCMNWRIGLLLRELYNQNFLCFILERDFFRSPLICSDFSFFVSKKEYHAIAHCTAGGCASIATSIVYTPSECVKQRMQIGALYRNSW